MPFRIAVPPPFTDSVDLRKLPNLTKSPGRTPCRGVHRLKRRNAISPRRRRRVISDVRKALIQPRPQTATVWSTALGLNIEDKDEDKET